MATELVSFMTGYTRIRPSIHTQPAERSVFRRRLRTLFDFSWTEWLPIYAFLIKHPEGDMIFETGCAPTCSKSNNFPWWTSMRLGVQVDVPESQTIGKQLRRAGVDPASLKAVVVSHMHHHHTAALSDVAGSPVHMTKEHWDFWASRDNKSAPEGSSSNDTPTNYMPYFLQATNLDIGPFKECYPITRDAAVTAFDTPGHVPGHISLCVFEKNGSAYLLTGHACYTQERLDALKADGATATAHEARESMKKIKAFCRWLPTVLLPSHDPMSLKRLMANEIYIPSRKQ